jgi:Regulator of chromosome condensation (RCC1) repeat
MKEYTSKMSLLADGKASPFYPSKKSSNWLKSALTHALLLWLFLGSSVAYGQNAVKQYRQVWLWLVLWVVFLPCAQAEGIITTVAGNGTRGFSGDGGPAISAPFNIASVVAVDNSGNLHIADYSSYRARNEVPTGILSVDYLSNACAIKNDGTLTCWGKETYTPPTGQFLYISGYSGYTCGVKNDGSLACWGVNKTGQNTLPSGTFSQVATGDSHVCAMKTDGTLVCWGDNQYGQTDHPEGIFSQISAGLRHTCGIKSDGTLACWQQFPLNQKK